MTAPLRIAAFVAVLALVFAAALATGAALDPRAPGSGGAAEVQHGDDD